MICNRRTFFTAASGSHWVPAWRGDCQGRTTGSESASSVRAVAPGPDEPLEKLRQRDGFSLRCV